MPSAFAGIQKPVACNGVCISFKPHGKILCRNSARLQKFGADWHEGLGDDADQGKHLTQKHGVPPRIGRYLGPRTCKHCHATMTLYMHPHTEEVCTQTQAFTPH